ncbi:S8 family peptidase, partial [Microbacterium sp. Leaf159]|uniref:S8 family peptidase n=1 Tax=Microbacterium sp. Leaf159 TaxID=1736279 RepID=UPI0019111319
KIQAIHDAGITGEGVTIAVLDAGLSPDVATLQGADIEVRQLDQCPDPITRAEDGFEALKHGTSATSLIVGNGTSASGSGPVGLAPGSRVLYYGVLQESCEVKSIAAALDDAVAQGADIVSMSGGYGRLADELSEGTVDSVAAALRAGVMIVTALPNSDSTSIPELMTVNGVVNVAAVDGAAQPATQRDGSSMTNADVDVVAPGIDVAGLGWDGTWGMSAWSGTSASTPVVAGLLALAKEKWPGATSSQLLQSLIRNTGSEPHELEWSDTIGHGVVNATRLLEEDPAQYPDENPLFKDGQAPTFDEVYSAPESSAPDAADAQNGTGPGALPWVLAGGGAVVVVVAVTLIVVIRTRRGHGGMGGDDVA